MTSARPTLRCLRDDLRLPVPVIDDPVDEIGHPLLDKVNDFYAALAADAAAARARYNAQHGGALTTDTYTKHLLPTRADRVRYAAEANVRVVRRLRGVIHQLVRASLLDGNEHDSRVDAFRLGIQVRADHGHETYVAVLMAGSVPAELVKAILRLVPGCDHEGWYPEVAMPERALQPREQVWSTLMDPTVAAKLLDGH